MLTKGGEQGKKKKKMTAIAVALKIRVPREVHKKSKQIFFCLRKKKKKKKRNGLTITENELHTGLALFEILLFR